MMTSLERPVPRMFYSRGRSCSDPFVRSTSLRSWSSSCGVTPSDIRDGDVEDCIRPPVNPWIGVSRGGDASGVMGRSATVGVLASAAGSMVSGRGSSGMVSVAGSRSSATSASGKLPSITGIRSSTYRRGQTLAKLDESGYIPESASSLPLHLTALEG